MRARLADLFYRMFLPLRVDQRGATATEYSVLLAFIVLAAMAGVQLFGIAANGVYEELAAELQAILPSP